MSRSRRIRGLDSEQRRSQRAADILEAALSLFAERGYQGTSIEAICQTAFVSTKSFYEIFASREQCYLALYDKITSEYRSSMSIALESAPDSVADATHHLMNHFVTILAADPRRAQTTFGLARSISPAVETVRRQNRRWAAEFLDKFWRSMGISGDHTRIGIAVVGGIFDVIADWLYSEQLEPPSAAAQASLVSDLEEFYRAVHRGLTVTENDPFSP